MFTAKGSNSQLLRVAETAWGTTPVTPTGTFSRYTGHTLNPDRGSFESKEIRGDRQTADLRLGILTGMGDLDFELSALAHDDLIEAALGGTWATNVLAVGSTRHSFTMEAGHPDIGQYMSYTGVLVDKMSFDFKPDGMVTGKFGLVAKSATSGTASVFGTTAAAPTASPMDTFSGLIKLGGAAIAIVSGLTLDLNNGIETAKVLGQNSLADANQGRASISGLMTVYFQDATAQNLFLNETESSLEVKAVNGINSYDFLMSRVKFTGAKKQVTKEGLLTYDLPYTALAPLTGTNTALKITRV